MNLVGRARDIADRVPDVPGGNCAEGARSLELRARALAELLRKLPADYLRLFEPDQAAHIDLDRITPLPDSDAHPTRVLANLPALAGGAATLLLQVFPLNPSNDDLRRCLSPVIQRLELELGNPVLVSAVILHGGRSGCNTINVAFFLGEPVIRLYLTTVGLHALWSAKFLERPEPLAWALAALMRAREPQDPRELARARVASSCLPATTRDPLLAFLEALSSVGN